MFYSKEILTRKDSNLGVIWLAAMMGARSGINKLSKKEVNGVNIVQSCRDISQPPEPLALRFSSNLMFGLIRVYNQQYNFYHSDVNNTWIRLKRDLAVLQSDKLDMVTPAAKLDAITFDYDLAIEQDVARPSRIPFDWDIELSRDSRSKELAIEFGWASQSSMDLRDGQSDRSSVANLMLQPSDELRRRITLDEQSRLTGSLSADLGEGGFNVNLTDDVLMSDDHGLYFDAEGNLLDYMPEQRLEAVGDGAMMDKSVSSGAGDDSLLGKRKRIAEDDALLQEQELPLDFYAGDQTIDLDMLGGDQEGAEGVVPQKRPRGDRTRRPIGLVIDERTMLSHEDLVAARDNYFQYQQDTRKDREAKLEAAAAKTRFDRLLTRPVGVSHCGPDLEAFWSAAIPPANVPAQRSAGRARTPVPTTPTRTGHYRDEAFLGFDQSTIEMDQGFDMHEEDTMDIEFRRRHGSVGSAGHGTPAGLSTPAGPFTPAHISTAGSHSKGTGAMPWSDHVNLRASVAGQSDHSGGGSERAWPQDFETAYEQAMGGSTLRPRQISGASRASIESASRVGVGAGSGVDDEEDEPLLLRRRGQHLQHSRSQSREREWTTPGFEGIDPSISSADRGGNGTYEAGQEQHDPAEGMVSALEERAAVEKETIHFLGYIRSILREAGGGATSFSFADVISVHQRRDVAASAFYHILTLSTMGIMRPTQDEPYKDIHIEVMG